MSEPGQPLPFTCPEYLKAGISNMEDRTFQARFSISNFLQETTEWREQRQQPHLMVFRPSLTSADQYRIELEINVFPSNRGRFLLAASRVAQKLNKIRSFTRRFVPIPEFVEKGAKLIFRWDDYDTPLFFAALQRRDRIIDKDSQFIFRVIKDQLERFDLNIPSSSREYGSALRLPTLNILSSDAPDKSPTERWGKPLYGCHPSVIRTLL